VYSLIPKQVHRKWDDTATVGVLVGFDTAAKGYRILNPKTNKVWVSHSVRIIEDVKRTPPSDNSHEPEAEVKTENHEVDLSPLISLRCRLPSEEDVTHLDVGDSHSEASDIKSQPDSSEQKEEAPHHSKRTNKGIPAEKLSYKVKTDDILEPLRRGL
jgi:hypothetical protein